MNIVPVMGSQAAKTWLVRLFAVDELFGVGSGGMRWACLDGVIAVALFALAFVDWMLARVAWRWPLCVAVRSGGQRRSCLVVMVGKVVRYPACIALAKVDRVGEKRDLWWKAIRSAIVGASITELSEWYLVSSIVQSLLAWLSCAFHY